MFFEIFNNKYFYLMVLLAKEHPNVDDIEKAKKLLCGISFEHFYEICCEHEFESIVYPSLKKLYSEKIIPKWHESYIRVKEKTTFMIDKLEETATRLYKEGIRIVALKNSGIFVAYMDDNAKCPMGDIDILVRRKDFLRAHDILTEMGFTFKFRSEYEYEDLHQAFIDGGAEYYYRDNSSGNDMWFEMSWRPIAGRWIRIDKEPDANILIKESKIIKGSKIGILAPEDNLLQIAVHTAKHSYVRKPGFRLHLDVYRIVENEHIDWDAFYRKVLATGVKTAVYFSLFIAKQIYEASIPNGILERLRPTKYKKKAVEKMLRNEGLLHPNEVKFSKGFLFFQTMLYDKWSDIFKVILPSVKWLKKKYNYKLTILTPYYVLVRILDLAGVRKKKPGD